MDPSISPVQRRTMAVLVLAQVLSGAGLAVGVTVGALLAAEMLGGPLLAGVPVAAVTVGSALAAVVVGRISQRFGRRTGLAVGYGVGTVGSVGVVLAAVADSVALLVATLFLYGAGTATNLQARYAGADLAHPARRGRAVSTVLVATTLGAVAGPNLVEVMGRVAASWGIPVLAGPFILAAGAYGSAAVVLWALLRPDPLLLARSVAGSVPTGGLHRDDDAGAASTAPTAPASGRGAGGIVAGTTVMIVTQLVMVAIMTMTPVHMEHHGHGLAATGLVIAVHVAGMYLPSPVSGVLVDRVGRLPVAGAAAVTLLAAGLVSGLAPADSVLGLTIGLGLLGLGWNLGLVSGTAIIADVPAQTRARTQGTVDLGIALAGAGGSMASGVVVASSSYAVLSLLGGVAALAVIPIVAITSRRAVRGASAAQV